MRPLLAFLFFIGIGCTSFSQVPSYVPSEGLISFFPFDSTTSDLHSSSNALVAMGTPVFQTEGQREFIYFDGSTHLEHPNPTFPEVDCLSLSFWVRPDEINPSWDNPNADLQPWVGKWLSASPLNNGSFNIGTLGNQIRWTSNYLSNLNSPESAHQHDWNSPSWHHVFVSYCDGLTLIIDGDTASAYNANSVFIDYQNSTTSFKVADWYSALNSSYSRYEGAMDELVLFNRPLEHTEILGLFLQEDIVGGCTNVAASNFDEAANMDDGTCLLGCLFCGEGTVWDDSTSTCIIANPSDVDLDGCTGVGDVLNVLANFGGCYPDAPYVWTCGDPLTYWDYDYATVLIGDQCWFAENLRTEQYSNGDSILADVTDSEWSSLSIGATAVYGEGNSDCESTSPDFDACDETQSLSNYGRLYNWFAVDDVRGLCFSGWHVPSDEEWSLLESHLGLSAPEIAETGYRGTNQGLQLKGTSGWHDGGFGTNEFGFNALPGGYRRYDNGTFRPGGDHGYWYTSSNTGTAWYRYLSYDSNQIGRNALSPKNGYSVRCVKD